MDIKALMEKESDPKYQDLQARYQNARTAVYEGYKLGCRGMYPCENTYDNEGKALSTITRKDHDDEMVRLSRMIAKHIEMDLNATLSILEAKDEDKAQPAKVLGLAS